MAIQPVAGGSGSCRRRCRIDAALRFALSPAALPAAGVAELVDAPDSKSGSERSVGSIPTARTIF
jgi:hypothetical protein